jgi:hypothetical protein
VTDELIAALTSPLLDPGGLLLAEVGRQLENLVSNDRRRVDAEMQIGLRAEGFHQLDLGP